MRGEEYKNLMAKSLDVSFLRNRIVPGMDLCLGSSWRAKRRDLKELSELHGAKIRIVKKCSDETISGAFEDFSKIITLVSESGSNNILTEWQILTTFTHELAHAFQYEIMGLVPQNHQGKFLKPFRNKVLFEQTAEELAYYLAMSYFPSLSKKHKIKPSHFKTYFNKEDILYIAERYGVNTKSEEVLEVARTLSL